MIKPMDCLDVCHKKHFKIKSSIPTRRSKLITNIGPLILMRFQVCIKNSLEFIGFGTQVTLIVVGLRMLDRVNSKTQWCSGFVITSRDRAWDFGIFGNVKSFDMGHQVFC